MLTNIFVRSPWDDHREYQFYAIWIISLALSLYLAYKFKIPNPNSRDNRLNAISDYVEAYSYIGVGFNPIKPLYVIFIKDYKMGLLNVATYSIKLPANFELPTWHKKNEYLNVRDINGPYIMDIHGKILN